MDKVSSGTIVFYGIISLLIAYFLVIAALLFKRFYNIVLSMDMYYSDVVFVDNIPGSTKWLAYNTDYEYLKDMIENKCSTIKGINSAWQKLLYFRNNYENYFRFESDIIQLHESLQMKENILQGTVL